MTNQQVQNKFPRKLVIIYIFILILIPIIAFIIRQYTKVELATQSSIAPGSCKILEEKYCSTAILTEWTNPQGNTFKLVGFHLPAGALIFAHITGQATRVEIKQPASVKGFQTTILDPNSVGSGSVYITGDLEFDAFSTTNVKEGSIIARVGDRGITNYGNYNVIVRAGRFDETLGRAVSADDMLRELFRI